MERSREIFTPEQAAEYLQVDRETIYRYIRQGKLVASKLGRTYRIPRASIDLLLWATRTRKDVSLREYTGNQITEFLKADELDQEAKEIAERFSSGSE
ncbi:MAG TPA: helix-turn-helix domain-containing protein [Anaerolineales bacterium]|jgi:excisionase family DNA binding protein|nr:helix-turn-helix domain-containing protein [Anaerolineales bacterium]